MVVNWTSADLAAIDQAIATGATRVRFADGREVTYRSLAEMREIRTMIAEATGLAVRRRPRVAYVQHGRD